MKPEASDLFDAVRNAQKAGLTDLLPAMNGRIAPGERFFESIQSCLQEKVNLEKLDEVLYNCAPVIRHMADESHWTPADFTGDDMFKAVRNLQKMGCFDAIKIKTRLPGDGKRYFEHYQEILTEKIGVETLDRLLHTLGQCIKFLASEESMVNAKSAQKGEPVHERYRNIS
jgi:hypothetical protein